MISADTVHVVQISDVHYTEAPGVRGFVRPDADLGLAAVLQDAAADLARADLVAATGDLADVGHPDAYRRLGEVLATVPAPVYCLPGNHDADVPFRACLPRPGVHIETAVRVGTWLMLFLDTNAMGQEDVGGGVHRDLDRRMLLADEPLVTPAEEARARAVLGVTDAEHVLLWVHQPPLASSAPTGESDGRLAALVRDFPKIRAIAGGHLHGTLDGEFEGRPVLVCPSTTYNIDYDRNHFEGPGYRVLALHADGRVESESRTVPGEITDAMRERPAPRYLTDLMMGRITIQELSALSDEDFEARFGVPRPAVDHA